MSAKSGLEKMRELSSLARDIAEKDDTKKAYIRAGETYLDLAKMEAEVRGAPGSEADAIVILSKTSDAYQRAAIMFQAAANK